MRRRFPRVLGALLAALVLCLLCLVVAVAWWLPQSAPATQPTSSALQVADVGASHRMPARDELRDAFHGRSVEVVVSSQELNTLLQDMAFRLLGGSGQVSWTRPEEAQVVLSLPLQRTPLRLLAARGEWLNVHATLARQERGVPQLVSLRLGSVPVPSWLGVWAARRVAAHYQMLEAADIALSSVDTVAIEGTNVRAVLTWRGDLNARALDLVLPSDDQGRLLIYQRQLADLMHSAEAVNGHEPDIPLLEVMRPMFQLARQRAMAQAIAASAAGEPSVAARENRAVLLVLALHAGKVPVGRLMPGTHDWPTIRQRALTLHHRIDFAQHFLLSALLATDVGGRLADVIGIYKEMMDTHRAHDGSGFSFNDIAADRAGIRFGQRAKQAPVELQSRLLEAAGDAFVMPEVDDLPQFLSEADFQRLFGSVGSKPYNAVLQEIDRRVNQLPVLQ